MVQWFCVTSWRLFDVWTSYFGIKGQCDLRFDLYNICVSTLLFGIMSQDDQMFYLKINVGHYDLYFIVQWFCHIYWRLFDVCTSYFGSMNQYDQMFDLKINVGHCDLYSMVQWFCLISWRLFDVWRLLFGITSQYDPTFYLKIKIGSLWPIFYGPVILRNILTTVWCMNIILKN